MLDIKNGMLRDEDAFACNLNSEGFRSQRVCQPARFAASCLAV